jgi:very-short-patch-repair endonuclease
MAEPDPVLASLLKSRVELLDLSLRNPLLNYRLSVRRGIDVVDETSAQIFDILHVQEGSLRFHPTKESGPDADQDEFTPGTIGTGQSNAANSLATPYTREVLAERLRETHSDAWLSLQERGANTLFLALGMLRWREEEPDTPDRLAPILLIPAKLERTSARAQWTLSAGDDDPGVNLSLAEKLRVSHGLSLPVDPPLDAVDDLERLFAAVEQAVADKPGWAVLRDRVALGFFGFGKFLMYRDLDPVNWPAERSPARHEVLAGLLRDGFRDRAGAVDPGRSLDALRPPGPTMEVMDCDSSQAEALMDVASGRHLVIQGPPGTGKSQTISNLIAEAVHAGKKVLFVAEKLAALEVVQRRLENIGLGELCLELHSDKSSKKEVTSELARTLGAGKPEAAPEAGLVEGLGTLRDRLNAHAAAVGAPVGNSGLAPFHAVGRLERLRVRALPRVPGAPMAEWTSARFEEALDRVEDLAAKLREIGVPAKHPFDGCGLTAWLPGDREKVEAALAAAAAATRAARDAAAELGKAMGSDPARDAGELEACLKVAALAIAAPDLSGVPPIGDDWLANHAVFTQALAALKKLLSRREAWASRVIPQAWSADLLQARVDINADGASWLKRLFSGRYKAAKRLVQGLSRAPMPKGPIELLETADGILEVQAAAKDVEARSASARAYVGGKWRGAESSVEELSALGAWAMGFRAAVVEGNLPAALGTWVTGAWDRKELKRTLEVAREKAAERRAAWDVLKKALAWGGASAGFAAEIERSERWRAELPRLPGYVGYNRVKGEVEGLGLGELATLAHAGTLGPDQAAPALEEAWARQAAERAFRERPELRDFDATTHAQAVERFGEADAAAFAANRARLAEKHWRGLPPLVGFGQVGTLRRECAKKTRHIPIRKLMIEAGRAVLAAKPVFLMSPLSIAAFLPPDVPPFDLVVFDEASQVKPVDAFGAILRGKQLVVVGDEKQMPPTSFFDTMMSSEADADEENAAPTKDMQSILGLCGAKGMPSRMLRWHYRSRHDSLIALSNREFYEGKLVVFPSPARVAPGEGLAFRHLPDTAYERGTSRTNPKEADAVVAAVLEHSRTRPELSLGVVAFSQAQKDAIEKRVEALARKDAAFDQWTTSNPEEPFFVKNLENVQGDERDVMMISVGYGRNETGAVSMNFGPLNQAGGERRLNVLITRARRQCAVFTNLSPDDIDLARAPGEGVRALKAFLAFARAGRLPEVAGEAEEVAELEAEVAAALAAGGLQVERSVGAGGFRVGLAVKDPATPGRFLLGIEFDGPRYQSARWARDRDRLRDAVLRGLGWRLHRIWTADWYKNREEALRRCREAVARPEAERKAAGPRKLRRSEAAPPGRPPIPPYQPAATQANIGDLRLAEVSGEKLGRFAAGIVERESPMHQELLRRRVLEAIDQRPGAKRLQAIDEAVAAAVSLGLVRRQGDFLWKKEPHAVTPRDRSGLDDASRGLEYVCDEECQAALLRAVDESHGCPREDAAVQAIKILGVKRNEEALARLAVLADGLVRDGALRLAAGQLALKC